MRSGVLLVVMAIQKDKLDERMIESDEAQRKVIKLDYFWDAVVDGVFLLRCAPLSTQICAKLNE